MWQKLTYRNKEYYIQSTPNAKKAFAAYDRSGKLLCRFGAPGASIEPGTPKGNSYCARSAKIKTARPNIKSPNFWSRANWSCQGTRSKSRKNFFGKARKISRPPFL